MSEKYYLDTCIWLDFYEKRGVNGEIANRLIINILKERAIIIWSDLIVLELKNLGYSENEILEIYKIIRPENIRYAFTNKKQIEETKLILTHENVPERDILHAIIARDNEAILISTDRHFEKLKYIVESKKPNQLI